MKKSYGALVVGAGIGGMHAALSLAETGQKVALVDAKATLGGLLTQLDHQFPSDNCGMCKMLPLTERDSSSQFCMRKGLFHRNIDVMPLTELHALEGEPGLFQATLKRHSPFVDPHKCIGCGRCSEVCPVRVPSEFNAGLSERAAIHLPVPQAIPNAYTVDLDNCVRCLECVEACPTGAVDFQLEKRAEFPVLLAHPDPEAAEPLAAGLRKREFPVHSAANAEEAVAALESGGAGLVLASLDLPRGDAERIIGRALELAPATPVVLLAPDAATANGEAAKEMLDKGAAEVMVVPEDPAKLVPDLEKRFMRLVSDELVDIDVASVILAAGFQLFDPATDPAALGDFYLYGQHPAVLTSMEMERWLSGTGLDAGRRGDGHGGLPRPRDGRPVKRIAWLQCVGSRDVQRQGGFCSSFCCLASLKEARLVRKRARELGLEEPEATVFYMDVRTHGKDFQRYCDQARDRDGVRFVRARIHTLLPSMDDPGQVRMQYVDETGKLVTESFDMAVLAVGARPPRGMEELARVTGIETNEWGFCQTANLTPSRTSRMGVMAAGSFAWPADISESMILSGAAALEASRLINIYAPLKERKPEPRPEYRDVRRERPRVLAALCTACPLLEEEADMGRLAERLGTVHGVASVESVPRCCTAEGWERITELMDEHKPNRLLIGACMPYAYVPKLRELSEKTDLNPALMDVVDVYSPLMAAGSDEPRDPAAMADRLASGLTMAAVRLLDQDPEPVEPVVEVSREALVVGGGVAGMTAALGVADHGYNVCLVEEAERLGGLANKLHTTLTGDDPVRFVENLVEQVEKHPRIRVFLEARVALSTGRAGHFMSLISTPDGTYPLEHGATILATGGREVKVHDFGLDVHKKVMTQRRLEEVLASGELDLAGLSGVAMIQCWRSRDENRNYCSRVCCPQALKNALLLKKRRPDLPVVVLYRDIMTPGFMEEYYTRAREAGVLFVPYTQDDKPRVEFEDGRPRLTYTDPILAAPVAMDPDLLVLSIGLEAGEAEETAEVFGVELDQDGFFREAESKWRPVDSLKQGVFYCGVARAPGGLRDTVASAKAAAQRALRILSETRLAGSRVTARVRHSLCSRCGRCIEVCPYGARRLDMRSGTVVVDDLLCQGCGSCAAVCPNSASFVRGFTDRQVMGTIDAALAQGRGETCK